MPNIFSKIFRRRSIEGSEKDSLVEQHSTGGRTTGRRRNNRKASPSRRGRKGLGNAAGAVASTASSTTTEVAANTTKIEIPVISPQKPTSPTGVKATTSTTIINNNSSRTKPGYEVAPSTGSTSRTSERGESPTPTDDVGDPRSSPKSGRIPQGTQRVLSPRSLGASPPSRNSNGPVDLDDENVSDEEGNMVHRDISAIPVFTMDGTGSPAPHLLLNKQHAEMNDDGSSLNFSTDADDDTEYLNVKRGVGASAGLDQSTASTYKSDGEGSIFPNLVDDKDSLKGDDKALPSAWDPNSPILDDFPTTSTANTSSSGNVSGFPSPPIQTIIPSAASLFRQSRAAHRQKPATSTTSTPSQPFGDDFAFEADFSKLQFEWPTDSDNGNATKNTGTISSNTETPPGPKKHSMVYIETGKIRSSSRPRGEHGTALSAASHSTKETSLEELLEKAKSKIPSRKSAGSVNSAPVKSSSLIRDGASVSRRLESRSTADGGGAAASVTDIIKNLDAANKTRDSGSVKSAKERLKQRRQQKESDESDEAAESWLFDEVTGALGPKGIAADLESLSGRSHQSGGGRSHKSHRSTKSKRRSRRSSGESVNSKDSKRSNTSRRSRSSRYSHRSTKSYISQMSEQSRSVANDLLRLEMQLAMVGQQQSQQNQSSTGGNDERSKSSAGPDGGHRSSRSKASASSSRRASASAAARRSRMTVIAPPGKLGIILANKADSKGTVVSGVRTSSVLAEKISPGDRIVAIDGEDVSLMTVSEITTIMARKADFERTLTVLTTPRTTTSVAAASNGEGSQQDGKKYRT
ncbi:hypothetical protein ACA910_018132 [Epithemia clementina (nom. ined.)]